VTLDVIPNLELRAEDGASLVFGGPGTERQRGYVAAVGFEVLDRDVEVSDDRTVAGVILLTEQQLAEVYAWVQVRLGKAAAS
jgi:hypothetical protein